VRFIFFCWIVRVRRRSRTGICFFLFMLLFACPKSSAKMTFLPNASARSFLCYFLSPKSNQKGFCDPKEISPLANHGCRQHGCAGRPFVSVTAISADRTLKPIAVPFSRWLSAFTERSRSELKPPTTAGLMRHY
jgi:hypothetical protein